MNKRDAAILAWIEKNRPDCVKSIKEIFDLYTRKPHDDRPQGLMLIMYLAFEGGRQFQRDTGAELGNPNVYL